jgi:hypothetical protein
MERLEEIGHEMDMQVNKASNNVISWIAPKNKAHSDSNSLRTWISVAVGAFSIGYETHMVELLMRLGIGMTKNYALDQTDGSEKGASERTKSTSQVQKRRNRKIYKKSQQCTRLAPLDRENGTGHAKGSNVEPDMADRSKKAVSKCSECGHERHAQTSSKKCLKNKLCKDMTKEAVLVPIDDGVEQDLMDKLAFDKLEGDKVATDLLAIDDEEEVDPLDKIIWAATYPFLLGSLVSSVLAIDIRAFFANCVNKAN